MDPQLSSSPLLRPPTILLDVIKSCDLSTLLSLRLASRAIHHLIARYESSIALAVARRIGQDCPRLLQASVEERPSIKWLFSIVARRLATVAVDRARCIRAWGISAADPLGDILRERVTHGWRVLWRLSDVARQVARLSDSSLAVGSTGLRRFFLPRWTTSSEDMVMARETEILRLRRRLIRDLTPQDVVDYGLMHGFMSHAWSTVDFGFGTLADLGPPRKGGALVWAKSSWINWLILRDGPLLFDELWANFDDQRTDRIERVRREWEARSAQQVQIEKQSARHVHLDLDARRSSSDSLALITDYQATYRAAVAARAAPGGGAPVVEETMETVPFFIDGLPPMPVAECPLYYMRPVRCF